MDLFSVVIIIALLYPFVNTYLQNFFENRSDWMLIFEKSCVSNLRFSTRLLLRRNLEEILI